MTGLLTRFLIVLMLAASEPAAGAEDRPEAVLDVPHFRQEKDGCGAASVAMVMQYWGSVMPSELRPAITATEIYRDLYEEETEGVRLIDMKVYLEATGFQAFTLHGEWADLDQHLAKGRPVIVALSKNRSKGMHFAVVSGLDLEHVWLNDPARKKLRRQDRDDFEKEWVEADRWVLVATPNSPR